MVFWSDDRSSLIVREGEEEFCYSVPEFIVMYGEETLPEMPEEKPEPEWPEATELEPVEPESKEPMTDFDLYYEAFLEFLNGVGNYLYFRKLGTNADDGVYIAQKVRRDYGHEGAVYDEQLDACKRRYLKWFRELSLRGTAVGFKPIDELGKRKIFRFVTDANRRRYIRDAAKRAQKKGELVSIADLMRKRYALEKKKAGKTGI